MSCFLNSRPMQCVTSQMLKPMLNSVALQDLGALPADASGNDDSQSLQTDLNIAMKVIKKQKGSLLEELGSARDTVKFVLTIVDTVAEVSSITSFLKAWLLNAALLGSSICKTRVVGCYGCL